MQYIKRNERFFKASVFAKNVKEVGGTVREVEEYSKWKELDHGRIQVQFRIIEFTTQVGKSYLMEDDLGFVACQVTPDLNEIKNFLTKNGFKPTKDWYIQDCGMSEETWKEWNSSKE